MNLFLDQGLGPGIGLQLLRSCICVHKQAKMRASMSIAKYDDVCIHTYIPTYLHTYMFITCVCR